jgi:hypothetical protein
MSLSITPRQENEVLTGYQLNPSFEATFFSFPFPFLLFLKKKKKNLFSYPSSQQSILTSISKVISDSKSDDASRYKWWGNVET